MKQRRLENLKGNIFSVFDQEYMRPDPAGPKAWSTKRDLNKVWDSPECLRAGFNKSNTVIVDAEAFKLRDFKENAVVVPEYTFEDLQEAENNVEK